MLLLHLFFSEINTRDSSFSPVNSLFVHNMKRIRILNGINFVQKER